VFEDDACVIACEEMGRKGRWERTHVEGARESGMTGRGNIERVRL